MAESKKYYWLKLNRGFFKRHDVDFIKEIGEDKGAGIGDRYVLFYVKLLVESIDHDGYLRFSEALPYDNRKLAAATKTNVQIVNDAMELFVELGLVEILEDKTIYMTNIEKMIGSEADSTRRVREHRAKNNECNTNVTSCNANETKCNADETFCNTDVTKCNTEIDKEKNKDTDTEEEENVCAASPKKKPPKHKYGSEKNVLLTDDEYQKLKDRFPDCDERIENMSVAIAIHGYKYNSHYLAIINWASKDNKPNKQEKGNNPFLDMLQNGG